jgi:hypothetical protein
MVKLLGRHVRQWHLADMTDLLSLGRQFWLPRTSWAVFGFCRKLNWGGVGVAIAFAIAPLLSQLLAGLNLSGKRT